MTESEAASAAALVFAAAVMVVAWLSDGVGLPIHPMAVLVAAVLATALGVVLLTRGRVSFSAARFAAFGGIVVGFTSYICWLAWPSWFPVTQGPDTVHHLSLIHFIQRERALPHDPNLGAYLGEMVSYTPGSHLLAALAGDWLRVDAIRIMHPVQAVAVAFKAGLVCCTIARLAGPGPFTVATSLAGTMLLLVPHRYLLEPIVVVGFYSQVIAETFAVGMLWTLVAWWEQPSRAWLLLAAAFGVGVVLSWPVYLPAPALAVAMVMLFRWRAGGIALTRAIGDAAIALAPAALTAVVFTVRHASSAGILRSGGTVLVPSASVFGWAFLFLVTGGLVLTLRQWRTFTPVLAFAAACLAQVACLAVGQTIVGATNLYLANKTVFLLMYPVTIMASLTLIVVARHVSGAASAASARLTASARATAVHRIVTRKWKSRATNVLLPAFVLALAVVLRSDLPLRPLDSPISEDVYRAGLWAKGHVPAACVDYMVDHWITGYWLHLDTLGNPRASERMRTETFDYRRTVAEWILPGGRSFAIVEELSKVPADARQTMAVLHQAGAAAVVTRTDSTGTCPRAAPPIDIR